MEDTPRTSGRLLDAWQTAKRAGSRCVPALIPYPAAVTDCRVLRGQWIQRPIDHGPQTAASVAVAARTGRIDSQITLPLVMLAKATPLALATRVVNRYGALHGFVKSPTFL